MPLVPWQVPVGGDTSAVSYRDHPTAHCIGSPDPAGAPSSSKSSTQGRPSQLRCTAAVRAVPARRPSQVGCTVQGAAQGRCDRCCPAPSQQHPQRVVPLTAPVRRALRVLGSGQHASWQALLLKHRAASGGLAGVQGIAECREEWHWHGPTHAFKTDPVVTWVSGNRLC